MNGRGCSVVAGIGPMDESRPTDGDDGEVEIGEALLCDGITVSPVRRLTGLLVTLAGDERPPTEYIGPVEPMESPLPRLLYALAPACDGSVFSLLRVLPPLPTLSLLSSLSSFGRLSSCTCVSCQLSGNVSALRACAARIFEFEIG